MSEHDTLAEEVEHNILQWSQLAVLGLILSEAAGPFYLKLGGVVLAVLCLVGLLRRYRSRLTPGVLGS